MPVTCMLHACKMFHATSNLHFATVGKNINCEVRKVMGPSSFRVNYDSAMRSMSTSSPIPRKPKRYSKSTIAVMKYGNAKKKGRLSSACFQRSLLYFVQCQT